MLWFNFIFGLIFVFLCVKLVIIVYHKQNKENENCINEKITLHILYTHDICAGPWLSKRDLQDARLVLHEQQNRKESVALSDTSV